MPDSFRSDLTRISLGANALDFRRHLGKISLLVLLLFGIAGCDSGKKSEQTENTSELSAPDTSAEENPVEKIRLVTVGGTVTETVFALGAGEDVVAADKSSVYPPEAAKLATLDLFRKVSAEAILSLKPTMVLATSGAKPDEAFELIEKAGVEVIRLDDEPTIDAMRTRAKVIGEALGRPEAAAKMNAELDKDLADAKRIADQCDSPAKTLFIYSRGPGMTFVGGTNTKASAMIELAGGTHVPDGIEGFKPMTAEAVLAAEPDVLLMSDSGLKSSGGIEGLRKLKGLGQTRAIKDERIVTMGDLELLGFGPRTGKVAAKLASSLCLDDSKPASKPDGEANSN